MTVSVRTFTMLHGRQGLDFPHLDDSVVEFQDGATLGQFHGFVVAVRLAHEIAAHHFLAFEIGAVGDQLLVADHLLAALIQGLGAGEFSGLGHPVHPGHPALHMDLPFFRGFAEVGAVPAAEQEEIFVHLEAPIWAMMAMGFISRCSSASLPFTKCKTSMKPNSTGLPVAGTPLNSPTCLP